MMIISDHGLEKLGVVEKIQKIVEDAGIETCTFLDILPNPTVDMVDAATKIYKESGATRYCSIRWRKSDGCGESSWCTGKVWRIYCGI